MSKIERIYPTNNQKTAIQFLDYVLSRLPFGVEVIQTDNGAEFQSGFHWHVLDRGIQHAYIKPRVRRRYLGAYTAGIRDNHNRCGR